MCRTDCKGLGDRADSRLMGALKGVTVSLSDFTKCDIAGAKRQERRAEAGNSAGVSEPS